jgi:hypothetical protein
MDTRYFGNNLLALHKTAADHRRIWTEAEEDAYYQEHAPGRQRGIPRIGVAIAGVVVGLVTLGLWPS